MERRPYPTFAFEMKHTITYIEEADATVYGSTLTKAYEKIADKFPFLKQGGNKRKSCSLKISCSKRFIYLQVPEGLVDREVARLFLHELFEQYLLLRAA